MVLFKESKSCASKLGKSPSGITGGCEAESIFCLCFLFCLFSLFFFGGGRVVLFCLVLFLFVFCFVLICLYLFLFVLVVAVFLLFLLFTV